MAFRSSLIAVMLLAGLITGADKTALASVNKTEARQTWAVSYTHLGRQRRGRVGDDRVDAPARDARGYEVACPLVRSPAGARIGQRRRRARCRGGASRQDLTGRRGVRPALGEGDWAGVVGEAQLGGGERAAGDDRGRRRGGLHEQRGRCV